MNVSEQARGEWETLRRALEDVKTIVVSTHLKPDGDAIGSEAGMLSFLEHLGKSVRIINNDPTPDSLRFVEPAGGRVDVYASEDHDALLRKADAILLLDNAAPDRFGRMEPILRELASKVICIDHHPSREVPWSCFIQDTSAAATAQMVFRITHAAGWSPAAAIAQSIYVGLATDTGFFRFNSTRSETHQVAAGLLACGADSAAAYAELHERKPLAFTKLLGYALTHAEFEVDHRVAIVCMPHEIIQEFGAGEVDTSEFHSALLAIDGIEVVIMLRELEVGSVKASLRSKGSFDVNQLALEFGGGGHRNAAGVHFSSSLESAKQKLVERGLERFADYNAAHREGA